MTEAHYFSSQPSGPENRRTITATVWGQELTMITANGVFAADGLDRGTAVLLQPEVDTQVAWFWLALLATFDVVFVTLALWTFEPVMTD